MTGTRAGVGARAWGFARLLRPLNCALAALGVLAGMVLTTGDALPLLPLMAAPLAAFLVTGFGNTLNDLRDVDVDRIAHPQRPLPSGAVGRRGAARFAAGLLSIGLAASLLAGVVPFLFAVCTVALLLAYEARLKRLGFSGNAAVAALTASTFLFGAVATGRPWWWWQYASIAAAMAFCLNLAREVAKDAEDVDADRGVRRTLPMQVGGRNAGLLAAAAAAVGILASWPFVSWIALAFGHRNCTSGVAVWSVLAADVVAACGAVAAVGRPALAQRLLKVAMALALLGFLLLRRFGPDCYVL